MPRRLPILLAGPLLALSIAAPPASAQGSSPAPAENRAETWGAVRGPGAGPPRSIGGTSLGCLSGAAALPTDGPGWQVVRLSRNRNWGHPGLVAWLRDFAGRSRAAGLPDLWIGDLSQPRGGPMRFGHASHQTGLDADIWLDLRPKPLLPVAARESIEVPSVVRSDGEGIDPTRWTPQHAALIRLAASSPGIDRVLVNPAIKRALCAANPGVPWLRYVRPWRGHGSHMHVRLRCQPGSPECQDLAPPPPGDGCDATLAWWFTEEARHPPAGRPGGPPPALPAACRAVLDGR